MRLWPLLICLALLPGRGLADELARGRAIYQGEAEAGLSIRLGTRLVPARGISCAGCHGDDAGGGIEAQAGPAIDWQTLSGARGYDAAALALALGEGRRPDGSTLGRSMPRFVLARPGDAEALAAYLAAVGEIQRTGISADAIRFTRAEAPGLQPFWQAFEAALTSAAPGGVFGRRIVLSADEPGFAALASVRPDLRDEQPDLFPLTALLGDEDPGVIRGAQASLTDQIAAVTGSGLQVLAAPEMASRMQDALTSVEGVTFRASLSDLRPATPVFVIGPSLLSQVIDARPDARIHATIDDLAQLPRPPEGCVTVTDPRPSNAPGPVLARYGRIAGLALVEALKACGPDCTRARLMRAFDGLRLEAPGWPALDYDRHRLTGTASVALWQVCGGKARRLDGP